MREADISDIAIEKAKASGQEGKARSVSEQHDARYAAGTA